jgi:thiamine monophosphate kinase
LGDGEDYELLFSMAPDEGARLQAAWTRAFPKLKLSRIGELTTAGVPPAETPGGYDHFRR